MSQRAFLAAMDASLHAGFAAAGMADAGLYTPPGLQPPAEEGGAGVPYPAEPCQVYVDRDTQTLGDTRQFKAGRVEVAYVLGSLATPPRKLGKLAVDGDEYLNDDELSNDGSVSRWVVRRG